MTFEQLPPDWSRRSVIDDEIFLDLVDLVVMDRDRHAGALYVLLCGPTERLVQPCVVADLPAEPVPDRHRAFEPFAEAVRTNIPGGGLVAIVARPGRADTTDADRAWHEAALAVCRRRGIPLLAAAVATPGRVWRLPDPRSSKASA